MTEVELDMFERAAQAGRVSWNDPNIDLSIRRKLLGETDPQPYFDLQVISSASNNAREKAEERGEHIAVDKLVLAISKLILFAEEDPSQRILRVFEGHEKFEEQQDRLKGRHRWPTKEQRAVVWLRDRGRCGYCESVVEPGGRMSYGSFNRMEIDHSTPWYEWGMTDLGNLVCSCQFCNVLKGRKSAEEFSEYRAETSQSQQIDDYTEQYEALGRR